MSRTDLDAATLARSLRGMAGDGSIEWVHEPIQTSVLLDVADMLDENAKLLEQLDTAEHNRKRNFREYARLCHENDKLRKLCELAFTCIEQGEDEYGTDWSCAGCEFCDKCDGLIQARATAQELGIEV